MESISPEIFQYITSFGVSGVLLLWLWDVRGALRDEKVSHERTQQKLEDTLKDCNRLEQDTRRLPQIPEAEKAAYRSRLSSEPP